MDLAELWASIWHQSAELERAKALVRRHLAVVIVECLRVLDAHKALHNALAAVVHASQAVTHLGCTNADGLIKRLLLHICHTCLQIFF